MKTPFRLLFVAVFIGLFQSPLQATSIKYPESSAIYGTGRIIHQFEIKNQRLPNNLTELSDFIGKPIDELYPQVTPSIRYAFYFPPPTLRINEVNSLQVIAIGRNPEQKVTTSDFSPVTRSLKGPGRYLLIREPDGDYFARWFEEDRIQRWWPSTGQSLPTPHNEPERPWVKKVRYQTYARKTAYSILAIVVPLFIIRRLRRRSQYGEGV